MSVRNFNRLSFLANDLIKIHLKNGSPRIFGKNSVQRTSSTSAKAQETFGTIQELYVKLSAIMGVEKGYKTIPPNRNHLSQYLPKSQADLPTRSMKDSLLVALIPLSTDLKLQESYITFLGHVRLGRLLEDMDIFAVMVAQKHIVNPGLPEDVPSPQTLVTALVDRIDFTDYVPKPHEDIKISGHVSWVGRSTMEVVVWLEQNSHGTWQRITRALFLIAARDPLNVKAAAVNALVPADDREKEIMTSGELRKQKRMSLLKLHVSKVIPNASEQQIIHDLYLRTISSDSISLKNISLPAGCMWMEDCVFSNVIFSHPENRNLHNTVFGGFIMRQASELSFIAGFKFSKYRPKVKSISDINFTKPIAVNSLIHMHAHVVFTHMQYIQIIVYVETVNPITGATDTTNTFNFTYEVPETVKEVLPKTYHEAMMYIDGRRHFFQVMESTPVMKGELGEEGVLNKGKL